MKKKKGKKPNYTITFECSALKINLRLEKYSPQIQKIINELNNPIPGAIITHSQPEFLETMVMMYEKDILRLNSKNSFSKLAEFIFRNFKILQVKNKNKTLLKSTLKSELYKYKNLNK